jgi:hypothetical protein
MVWIGEIRYVWKRDSPRGRPAGAANGAYSYTRQWLSATRRQIAHHHHLIKRCVVGLVGACSLLSYIIPSSYHRIHPLGCLQEAEMSAKITVAYHLKKMLVRP